MRAAHRYSIEKSLRPRSADVAFDLDRTLASVVALRAAAEPDGLTAAVLGTEREGNGVLIGSDGLVLTIGYLITEAHSVWLLGDGGKVSPAYVVGYDQESGFGLVKATAPLALPALELGSAAALMPGNDVVVAGCGGRAGALHAQVLVRREFAGYWEYVLDEAVFTTPAHPFWGGTGLLSCDGRLAGIGSLYIQHAQREGGTEGGNMSVPIDLLPPILEDLQHYGRRSGPARPWLGMLVQEVVQHLVVSDVYDGCPAAQAGMQVGDVIVAVDELPVDGLAQLFRAIWACGAAGVGVPLETLRDGKRRRVVVHSVDRFERLKTPRLH